MSPAPVRIVNLPPVPVNTVEPNRTRPHLLINPLRQTPARLKVSPAEQEERRPDIRPVRCRLSTKTDRVYKPGINNPCLADPSLYSYPVKRSEG